MRCSSALPARRQPVFSTVSSPLAMLCLGDDGRDDAGADIALAPLGPARPRSRYSAVTETGASLSASLVRFLGLVSAPMRAPLPMGELATLLPSASAATSPLRAVSLAGPPPGALVPLRAPSAALSPLAAALSLASSSLTVARTISVGISNVPCSEEPPRPYGPSSISSWRPAVTSRNTCSPPPLVAAPLVILPESL